MAHAIEFYGRLCRADQPPIPPGVYDLRFGLHPNAEGETTIWQEDLRSVPVRADGAYHVVLGSGSALDPELFDGSTRWLSVRLSRGGAPEAADRVPLVGLALKAAGAVPQIEARLAVLEAAQKSARDAMARRRVRILRRRLLRLEGGEGGLTTLAERVGALEARLARIDGESGKLARIQDELEDLVGPDGDVVDLDARLCRLEGVGTPGEPDRLAIVERRVGDLEGRLKRR